MPQQMMDANRARQGFRDVLDAASAGKVTVIKRFGKPTAVVIPYEDFLPIRELLEELRDAREAQAALAEYDRDPESFATLDDVERRLKEKGLLGD